MKKFGWVSVLVGLVVLVGTVPVWAQQPTPSDDEVNEVARDLYCPVCENVPLDVCPTEACKDWREQIREKLALGWNTEEIEAYFAEQYGNRVLSQPPRQGFNWLAYWVPIGLILLGAGVVIRVLWRARRVTASVVTLTAVERERLNEIEAALRQKGE